MDCQPPINAAGIDRAGPPSDREPVVEPELDMPRLFRYMRGMSRSRRWLTGRMDDLLIKANAGSHADLEALALLMYSGEASLSQRMLQDELGLSQPGTSRLVARLAESGMVHRISESNGGRSAELGLTDKARQVMTRIGPEYAAHVEAAARVVAEMVAESGVLSAADAATAMVASRSDAVAVRLALEPDAVRAAAAHAPQPYRSALQQKLLDGLDELAGCVTDDHAFAWADLRLANRVAASCPAGFLRHSYERSLEACRLFADDAGVWNSATLQRQCLARWIDLLNDLSTAD